MTTFEKAKKSVANQPNLSAPATSQHAPTVEEWDLLETLYQLSQQSNILEGTDLPLPEVPASQVLPTAKVSQPLLEQSLRSLKQSTLREQELLTILDDLDLPEEELAITKPTAPYKPSSIVPRALSAKQSPPQLAASQMRTRPPLSDSELLQVLDHVTAQVADLPLIDLDEPASASPSAPPAASDQPRIQEHELLDILDSGVWQEDNLAIADYELLGILDRSTWQEDNLAVADFYQPDAPVPTVQPAAAAQSVIHSTSAPEPTRLPHLPPAPAALTASLNRLAEAADNLIPTQTTFQHIDQVTIAKLGLASLIVVGGCRVGFLLVNSHLSKPPAISKTSMPVNANRTTNRTAKMATARPSAPESSPPVTSFVRGQATPIQPNRLNAAGPMIAQHHPEVANA
jgi:hypothetical protein